MFVLGSQNLIRTSSLIVSIYLGTLYVVQGHFYQSTYEYCLARNTAKNVSKEILCFFGEFYVNIYRYLVYKERQKANRWLTQCESTL